MKTIISRTDKPTITIKQNNAGEIEKNVVSAQSDRLGSINKLSSLSDIGNVGTNNQVLVVEGNTYVFKTVTDIISLDAGEF